MPAASNTLSLTGTLTRARTNGTVSNRSVVRALLPQTDVKMRELTVAAGEVGQALNLEGVTAIGFVLIATYPIKVYINGALVPFNSGSYVIVFDTNISSVTIDNDIPVASNGNAPIAQLIEYWFCE